MSEPHRAGFVALLGPPNAGKSTLLNRLLGEKLAIVTAKPQTTRSRILGICNLDDAQLMLVDTPGLHASTKKLNTVLNEAVDEALRNCDLALLLVDRTQGWQEAHDQLLGVARTQGVPIVVAGTKSDRSGLVDAWVPESVRAELASTPISAKTGEGIPELLSMLVERLPESPPLHPADTLTDRSMRWLAAELVREAAFEVLEQELPYQIAVDVAKYDESRAEITVIHANLLVSRESQKRIVVGRGGSVIREIGIRARRGIEKLVDGKVHLQLFVKVDPKWLKSEKRIEALGYH